MFCIYSGRCAHSIDPISFHGFRHALLAATKDRNSTAAQLQRTREFFHDRRFTGAADREIPDADDEATERALAENSFPIQVESELDDPFVDKRERVKNSA